MRRLGLRYEDALAMKADLRAAIARNNNDLLHSFRGGKTQPLPPETLAECARRWREELERKGLVGGRS